MSPETVELLKNIKEKIDKIDPFNPHKTSENCELKWESSDLLLSLIEKIENDK